MIRDMQIYREMSPIIKKQVNRLRTKNVLDIGIRKYR